MCTVLSEIYVTQNSAKPNCRPPDGIPGSASADTMRLLNTTVALLIPIVATAVIFAADVVVTDNADEIDDVYDASSMCSGGATGSASSVVVRGADGRLATHTLIDVSASCAGTKERATDSRGDGMDGMGGSRVVSRYF